MKENGNKNNYSPQEGTDESQYVIGIDTGGTYTDGVLLDYRSRRVLSAAKHLTTRNDLSEGVVNVLHQIAVPDPEAVQLVGISSTLATNSIAEKKARDVALLLIGYDRDLLTEYDLEDKFAARELAYFSGGHDSQGKEREALDLEKIKRWAEGKQQDYDAFAISSYFSPLNAEHEEKAAAAVYELTGRPVVMGHQLSTQLDSVRRATTAALNASLVSVMQEFIEAVRKSLSEQHIQAPIMVVKGDGSLMPYKEAVQKPVETIVSGPAASAIGGYFLCDQTSGLMIDVGGTTTDMALIHDSRVELADSGARVGDIETAVKTARIRTVGLGCDSWIQLNKNGREIQIGPNRVLPLCRLGHQYPRIAGELEKLQRKELDEMVQTDLEYWFLYRSPSERRRGQLSEKQNALVDLLLEEGPLSLSELLKRMEAYHSVQLNAATLLRQGYIERSSLTPTDLLHLSGNMDRWDRASAQYAADYLATLRGKDTETLCAECFDNITSAVLEEIIVFLAGKDAERLPEQIDGTWGRWFFEEFVTQENPQLSIQLVSHFPTVGLGAPAKAFIEKVAKKLGSALTLPVYHNVANAVGAVAGSVMVEKEALLFVQETRDKRHYTVHIEGEQRDFEEEEDAKAYAHRKTSKLALDGARQAGAADPDVTTEEKREGSVNRILAQAVGNPDISEAENPEDKQ